MTDAREELQAALGVTYAIDRELGGGGMSRAFIATERALGRQVVIKVLPTDMAGAVSVERFKREIAFAARLQQANIVPLLSAGEMGGVPYFTMPYIAGQSLRARLAAEGPLPIADAIVILTEVARALAYAHKAASCTATSSRILCYSPRARAMVTDFGVAKAISTTTTATGADLTGTGVALGTLAYMSPEQASGDPLADHRARGVRSTRFATSRASRR